MYCSLKAQRKFKNESQLSYKVFGKVCQDEKFREIALL